MVPLTATVARMRSRGGPDVIELVEVALPELGPKDVRIAVATAGVTYPDLLQRAGALPVPSLPHVLGFEVAGTVEAVGDEVEGLAPGMRVVAELPRGGGYATRVVVPASAVLPIRAPISFDAAVALFVTGRTALLILRHARLAPGESILIPSALGGVGSIAVHLATAMGATVLAAVGSEAKRARATALGASVAVSFENPEWADQVRRATDGRGVDVVLQSTGGPIGVGSLRVLAPLGRLVMFGADNVVHPEPVGADQVRALIAQGQSFSGFGLMRQPIDVRTRAFDELVDLAASGALTPNLSPFPFADVQRAHAEMEGRRTVGKVVLGVEARVTIGNEVRPPTSVDSPRSVLERFGAAVQAFSPDALANLFSEDATYEFPFLNPNRPSRYDGREAIRAGFREVWTPGRVKVGAIRSVVHETTDPEVVIEEGELDATSTATGRGFVSRFVLVARVRAGRIVHLRDYTDALRVARALDRLPSLAAALAE